VSAIAQAAAPLVDVRDVTADFRVSARDWRARSQVLRAVNRLNLQIGRGETLALVGESGCGKSTVGRMLAGLVIPTTGQIHFDGEDIGELRGDGLRAWRRRVQIVFQDPFAALNPRMKIGDSIGEPLWALSTGSRSERRRRVHEVLEAVGLPNDAANKYPNAFSGGQRQRICIARALALAPDLLIADEPVSALDVSVQAQIINLLISLQEELRLTLLFISHDLAVVRHLSTNVAVMYLGQIVELASRDALFASPLHPYTQSLLSAVPIPDPSVERMRARVVLSGEVPSPLNPPTGCRFHTRCPYAMPVCRVIEPVLAPRPDGGMVACHLVHPPHEESPSPFAVPSKSTHN
jgi:oligopeptide transport system ATP-binding protein